MAAPHYRKVELQSPADFTYLYANTVALSRQKLDLNLPPSATNDDQPDPMRERVRELVDEVGDQSNTLPLHNPSLSRDTGADISYTSNTTEIRTVYKD
jgi:hypothetical protein